MARVQGIKGAIDSNFYNVVEEFIEENKMIAAKVHAGLDMIVMGYAYTTLSFAQKMSAGPWGGGQKYEGRVFIAGTSGPATPQAVWSGGAWKIPVRRLTGRYWLGWKANRIGPATWRVYNESREAWFIEFGINHQYTGLIDSGGNRVRIRRPILKMAVLQAIEFAKASQFDRKMVTSAWYHTSAGSPELVGGTLYAAGRIEHY